jgi:hypothetical protein
MDKEQKRLRLSQIREEKEKIRQKILYHERQINKFTVHGIDTPEWSTKRLQHRHKIGTLMNEDAGLYNERLQILYDG